MITRGEPYGTKASDGNAVGDGAGASPTSPSYSTVEALFLLQETRNEEEEFGERLQQETTRTSVKKRAAN